MKIFIDHNTKGSVGTVATVKTRRWFKSVFTHYVCVYSDPIMGGRWINPDHHGKPPSPDLELKLNLAAAHAALRNSNALITAKDRP